MSKTRYPYHEKQVSYHDFLSELPFGYFVLNEEGIITDVNNVFVALLCEPREDILGQNFYYFCPEKLQVQDTTTLAESHFLKFDKKNTPLIPATGVFRLKTKTGHAVEVMITQKASQKNEGYKNEGDKGQTLYEYFVFHIESQPEWAQLRQSQNHLQRFFEKSPVGIILMDHEGKVVEANNAFLKYFDKEFDFHNKNLIDLLHKQSQNKAQKYFNKALNQQKVSKPVECKLYDNEENIFSLYGNLVSFDKGQGLIVQFIDITEQKNLEIRFAQSQKMQAIGQLAGGIAHDFNNLLTAMIGFCDLLLIRHKPGDRSFADVMQIKQNANRAASLVRQLLAFSRKQTLSTKVVNITDVIAELSHLLRRLLGVNIELKINHGRELSKIKTDPIQLEQVIINLAVNARDAMPHGGSLSILTRNIPESEEIHKQYKLMPEGDYILIEVKDTGTGIPQKYHDRIFEPFFSTKEVGSGTGLGLSTVYGIIKQTGGFIFVESEMGKGTVFRIYFPQFKGPVVEQSDSKKGETPKVVDLTGIGTILFVEDEDAVRVFGTRALENKGYKVIKAENAKVALQYYEKEAVDLIITDIVMPEMDGPTLIKKVREKNPDQKVICISGYAEDALYKHIDDQDDITFLPKPFSLKKLAETVKNVLES